MLLFTNNNASLSIYIDIALNIVNISLPSTLNSAFQTIFSFDQGTLSSFYNSSYNATTLKYDFFAFMQTYRMPPDDLYMSLPRPYDDYEYLLQTTNWFNLEDVSSRANDAGNNHSQCDGYSQAQIDAVINSLSPTVSTLQAGNALNQAYVYGFDEVANSCSDGVKQLFGAVQAKWPQIRTFSSLNWGYPPVEMPLNAWNVLYYLYNTSQGEQWVYSAQNRTQCLYHSVSPGMYSTFFIK